MNTVLAFLFMVAISQILPRGQMKIFFMKIQNKKSLIKSCPQAGFLSPARRTTNFFSWIKKVGKKIIGKHPRLPTIGLIATTKESFFVFASASCGLRAFKFIHFCSFQAAFVASAIYAKWVPVCGCQCREEEKSKGLRAKCGV